MSNPTKRLLAIVVPIAVLALSAAAIGTSFNRIVGMFLCLGAAFVIAAVRGRGRRV